MPRRAATRALHSRSACRARSPDVSAATYSTTRSRAGSRGDSSGTGDPSPYQPSSSWTTAGTADGARRAACSERGRST
jgi:hypothetical protein